MYGAMRLFVVGGRTPVEEHGARPADADSYPVRPGSWAAWARAQEAREPAERSGATECVTPSGKVGRLVRRFDGTHWDDVCEVA